MLFAQTDAVTVGPVVETADIKDNAITLAKLNNITTTSITEGTNLYYTDARARASISISDTGGDGSLSYNNSTGVIAYIGPSISETRAYLNATGDISYNSSTGVFTASVLKTSNIRTSFSVTSTSSTGLTTSLAYNNSTGVFTYTGVTQALIRARISAGQGITYDSTNGILSGIYPAGPALKTIQTSNFTAETNGTYAVNTTSNSITVTLPATPSIGNRVILTDYAGTFNTNNLIINPNNNVINGSVANIILNTNRASIQLIYINPILGWSTFTDGNVNQLTVI